MAPWAARAIVGIVLALATPAALLSQQRSEWGVPSVRPAEINCQVIEWNPGHKPYPQLTVACPPEGIYTPIRLYMVLSWEKKTDVPEGWSRIWGRAKYPTKIQAVPKGMRVKLKCYREGRKGMEKEWFLFTSLVRQAIIQPKSTLQ